MGEAHPGQVIAQVLLRPANVGCRSAVANSYPLDSPLFVSAAAPARWCSLADKSVRGSEHARIALLEPIKEVA